MGTVDPSPAFGYNQIMLRCERTQKLIFGRQIVALHVLNTSGPSRELPSPGFGKRSGTSSAKKIAPCIPSGARHGQAHREHGACSLNLTGDSTKPRECVRAFAAMHLRSVLKSLNMGAACTGFETVFNICDSPSVLRQPSSF